MVWVTQILVVVGLVMNGQGVSASSSVGLAACRRQKWEARPATSVKQTTSGYHFGFGSDKSRVGQ